MIYISNIEMTMFLYKERIFFFLMATRSLEHVCSQDFFLGVGKDYDITWIEIKEMMDDVK